jgi:hypothetical protein
MPRPSLSNRAAYRLAGGVIGLGLFASITPTPLYGTYSGLWHFSPLTLIKTAADTSTATAA